MHQWNGPGPDHATDVYPTEGVSCFTTQVVLQGLVAGNYKHWFVMGGCLVESRSFFGWFPFLGMTWSPLRVREQESQPCVAMIWTGLSFSLLMRPWCAVTSILQNAVLTTRLSR